MFRREIKTLIAGFILALILEVPGWAQSTNRPQDTCETNSSKAQATLFDRELVVKAEERSEALRVKLFEVTGKELDLLARLDDLDYRSSPEGIQRTLAFVGSARPMDELREALRIRLEREKARVMSQLDLLVSMREKLQSAIRDVDADLERIRQR